MVEDQRQTIMSKPISVLVVEYQPLTRIGIRSVVAGEADIELAGETDNGADGFAERAITVAIEFVGGGVDGDGRGPGGVRHPHQSKGEAHHQPDGQHHRNRATR